MTAKGVVGAVRTLNRVSGKGPNELVLPLFQALYRSHFHPSRLLSGDVPRPIPTESDHQHL